MASLRFILGSSSPRRQQLLEEAGFKFLIDSSRAEELHDSSLAPEELVVTNARLKASEVASRHPDAVVLGSDTLVYYDGVPLGKPSNLEDAHRMVSMMAGHVHEVATGVALLGPNGLDHGFCEITKVRFHPLSEEEVWSYLRSIEPLDKAGGYAAQNNGERIIDSISGCRDNVIGLPVQRLINELRILGLDELVPAGFDATS